jgi:hypothetical protein
MTDDDNNNNKKANLSLFTRRMHRGRWRTVPRNLGIRWCRVNFTPRPLYLLEKNPGAHWIRGFIGPRADWKLS